MCIRDSLNADNQTPGFQFNFDEVVTDFVHADINATNTGPGYFWSPLSDLHNNGRYYVTRFALVKNAGDIGIGTVSFTVASTSYQDLAGNLGTVDKSKSFTYDAVAPTVTLTPGITDTLGIGATTTLTFLWSEEVDDFDDLTDIGVTTSGTNSTGTVTDLTASSANSLVYTAVYTCLLYTSPSPRDRTRSRMPSSA